MVRTRRRSKGIAVLSAAALSLVGSALVVADPAAAAQNKATGPCGGGSPAVSPFSFPNGEGTVGPFRASTRCRDIQLRSTDPHGDFYGCVIFDGRPDTCSQGRGFTHVPAGGPWTVIAANVYDGTRFSLRIESGLQKGKVVSVNNVWADF